jgi:peptide/nickel transport system permease protein
MKTLRELAKYPSAVGGLAIVALLVAIAAYTLITIPYSKAISLWRGGEEIWDENPKNAQPIWMNWITAAKLPETIVLNSRDESIVKTREPVSEALTDVTIHFPFDFPYDV